MKVDLSLVGGTSIEKGVIIYCYRFICMNCGSIVKAQVLTDEEIKQARIRLN